MSQQENSDEDNSENESVRPANEMTSKKGSTPELAVDSLDLEERIEDDSSSLSEDERDMIYSRLYHSSSVLPTSTTNPPVNEQKSKEHHPGKKSSSISNNISANFTFELDLDDLPPPPKHTTPLIEITAPYEDSDFLVTPDS